MTGEQLNNRRRAAYLISLCLLGATAAIALMVWSLGVGTPTTNSVVTISMIASGMISGVLLIRGGLVCAPLPYFLIGYAAFFGLGTMMMITYPEAASRLSFDLDVQSHALPKVNAMNCLVGFLVLSIAGPLFVFMRPDPSEGRGLSQVLSAGNSVIAPLLAVSWATSILLWATFPPQSVAILDSFTVILQSFPLGAMILMGALWHSLKGPQRFLAVSLCVSMSVYGLLTLSKTTALLPYMLIGIGLLLGGRYMRSAVAVIVIGITVYLGFLAEVVNYSRGHDRYDPILNSAGDRVYIIAATSEQIVAGEFSTEPEQLLMRFSVVPFQTYFIGQYDGGFPGDSLNSVWVNIIPRILWPDKPLFAPGRHFDLVYRGIEVENHLGISFVGEAYWNIGWWGVLLVSVVIGLQLGWFTRKWIHFTTFGTAYIGIFLMSPILIGNVAQVDGDFIGGFVSSAIKTALFIVLIDIAVRAYNDYHRIRAS